jgi:hypothetical protein
VDEGVARVVLNIGKRIEIARVGQFIQIDYPAGLFRQQLPDETASDETSSAGDKDGIHGVPAEKASATFGGDRVPILRGQPAILSPAGAINKSEIAAI